MRILLLLTGLLLTINAISQNCLPDPFYRDSTGSAVYPRPRSVNFPNAGISTPACAGSNYDFILTVKIPNQFNGITLKGMQLATTGAVTGLPTGITYACSPPNCQFKADSTGCIRLFGTVADTVAPKIHALVINGTLDLNGFMLPVRFPDPTIAPGSYDITVLSAGSSACISKTEDFGLDFESTIYPNPVSENSFNIAWNASKYKVIGVDIFNLQGQKFSNFEAEFGTGLINVKINEPLHGIYLIQLKTKDSRVVKKLVLH